MADQNLNIAECIRSVSDFGQTHVHNICSGAVSTLPWGTADWAMALGATAAAAVTIFTFGALTFVMLRDG